MPVNGNNNIGGDMPNEIDVLEFLMDHTLPKCAHCKIWPENDAGFCTECADELVIAAAIKSGEWAELDSELPEELL